MRTLIRLVLIAIVLSGCTTERKAVKYFNNHPELSSEWCADKYPVRDSIAPPVIKYVKADNVDHTREIDSLNRLANESKRYADSVALLVSLDESECASIYKPIINRLNTDLNAQSGIIRGLRDGYKKCEPDTAFVTNTVYRENTARVKELGLKLDRMTAENVNNIKWKRFFMWWAIGASVVIGVAVALRLIRR